VEHEHWLDRLLQQDSAHDSVELEGPHEAADHPWDADPRGQPGMLHARGPGPEEGSVLESLVADGHDVVWRASDLGNNGSGALSAVTMNDGRVFLVENGGPDAAPGSSDSADSEGNRRDAVVEQAHQALAGSNDTGGKVGLAMLALQAGLFTRIPGVGNVIGKARTVLTGPLADLVREAHADQSDPKAGTESSAGRGSEQSNDRVRSAHPDEHVADDKSPGRPEAER